MGLWSLRVEVLLPVIFLVLIVLLWYVGYSRHRRELFEFYSSLGARYMGNRWLIFPLAELELDGVRVKIYTEGGQGFYALKASVELNPVGYLKLWQGNILDRTLFRKPYLENIFVEYEDKDWAEKILNREDFKNWVIELFSLPALNSFEIKNKRLTLSWHLGGMSRFKKVVKKEDVLSALKILVDISQRINSMPSAKVYKEDLRNWLTLKLPVLTTLFLITVGFAGGFYRYKPLCDHEILLVGFKVLTPIIILYTALVLFLVGAPTLGQRVILKTLFVCLVCTPFIGLFFFTWLNGHFDSSEPETIKDTITSKYYLIRGGHRILLAELHKNRWCDSLSVSEGFYIKAKVGDKVEYAVKKGFLGVPWLYRGLTLVE